LPLTNREGGGSGTKSTATIVQKYGGMLRFAQEEDVFITRIILSLDGRNSN
jgi:hypothetical protein